MKKKIICYPFVGDKIGGSHISSLLITQNIQKKFFTPIIAVHSSGILTNYLKNKKIKYFQLKNKTFLGEKKFLQTNFFNFFKTLNEIISFLRKNKVNIVHTNDLRIHFMWSISSKIYGCKCVWHQRSLFPDWFLYKLISRLPNKIVSISEYVYSSLPKFNKRKSDIIYNPFIFNTKKLSKEIVKKKLLKQLNINTKKYIVTFVANLEKRKKPLTFVKASLAIKKKLKNKVIFVMIGHKRDEKIFSEVLKYSKHAKNFFYLGYQRNIDDWLYGSDILIAPAINEPFGRTIVESMSLKTPVLASNSGGHREIIKNGKNGYLFDVNNNKSISQLAFKILGNKKKNKLIANKAYNFALKNYSISNHIKKIYQIYKNL